MSVENDPIRVTREGGVVTVVLDRPESRNALNDAMVARLEETFRNSAGHGGDRALVLTGTGGNFCSGADLNEPWDPQEHLSHRMRRVNRMVMALHSLPIPTIALIDGPAIGAGCNLALGCDLVVATPRARLSEIFVRRGLSIDCGGSWLLPRLLGLHKARELALLAPVLTADEAHALGLCNRVLEHTEAQRLVGEWAEELAALPPVALAQTKRLLDLGSRSSLEDALEAEALAQVSSFASTDAQEAVRAFRDKRETTFTGDSALPSLTD